MHFLQLALVRTSASLPLFALITALFFALGACRPSHSTSPGGPPSEAEASELLWSIIRYHGKLPGKATHMTKFDTEWDDHYQRVVGQHRLDWLYKDPSSGDIWMLVSRVAPSIHVKRVSTGIHLRLEEGRVAHYYEVFRTWKMPEEELEEKSRLLFGKMVRGEDLSMYYPEQAGDAYIEFPNAEVYFDTNNRYWVSTREDPLSGWRNIYGDSPGEPGSGEENLEESQSPVSDGEAGQNAM